MFDNWFFKSFWPNCLIQYTISKSIHSDFLPPVSSNFSQILDKLNVTNLMLRWKAPCALIAVDSEAALPWYPNQAWVGAGWWSWWQLVATERRAANSAINAGALVFASSTETFAILVDPSIVLTCAPLRFCWKDTYYSLLLTSSTPTVTQDTKKIPQDKWDQKVSGYKEVGSVRPPVSEAWKNQLFIVCGAAPAWCRRKEYFYPWNPLLLS